MLVNVFILFIWFNKYKLVTINAGNYSVGML